MEEVLCVGKIKKGKLAGKPCRKFLGNMTVPYEDVPCPRCGHKNTKKGSAPVTLEELQKRFTYHPPKPGQPEKYQALRDTALAFATLINDTVPESREKSLAITNLEEAVMWANAGIARNS